MGVLAGCGLAAAVEAIVWPRQREPEYKGRKLSEWLLMAAAAHGGDHPRWVHTSEWVTQTTEAVRHIGTNGLPFLVEWIDYRPSGWKYKAEHVCRGLPKWARRRQPIRGFLDNIESEDERRYVLGLMAAEAFGVLGKDGVPYIPRLARFVTDVEYLLISYGFPDRIVGITEPNFPQAMASMALHRLGTNTFPFVLSTLRLGAPTNDWRAAIGLFVWCARQGFFSESDRAAVTPALLSCLSETNSMFALEASCAITLVGYSNAVPEFCHAMQSADPRLRVAGACGLRVSREPAPSAVPFLMAALGDTNVHVRWNATEALERIAPQVLTNLDRKGPRAADGGH